MGRVSPEHIRTNLSRMSASELITRAEQLRQIVQENAGKKNKAGLRKRAGQALDICYSVQVDKLSESRRIK